MDPRGPCRARPAWTRASPRKVEVCGRRRSCTFVRQGTHRTCRRTGRVSGGVLRPEGSRVLSRREVGDPEGHGVPDDEGVPTCPAPVSTHPGRACHQEQESQLHRGRPRWSRRGSENGSGIRARSIQPGLPPRCRVWGSMARGDTCRGKTGVGRGRLEPSDRRWGSLCRSVVSFRHPSHLPRNNTTGARSHPPRGPRPPSRSGRGDPRECTGPRRASSTSGGPTTPAGASVTGVCVFA